MKEIIEESSNVGTIKVVDLLDLYEIEKFLRKFGFGSKTGIEVTGELKGRIQPDKRCSTCLASLAIGYSIDTTQIQMVKAYAIIANGGKGGLGNVRFKSSINRAPKKKTSGRSGEEFWIWLQLKVIADAGIIGLPNAGKSSLLSKCTRAKPKIANYPFTTINPNLGVLNINHKEIVLADIPGLIEGSHKGVGLGDKFLRHIERCKVLIHLIDISEKDIIGNYLKIRNELSKYDKRILKKTEIIVFNKSDLVNMDSIDIKMKNFKKKIKKSFEITSLISNQNFEKVKKIIYKKCT